MQQSLLTELINENGTRNVSRERGMQASNFKWLTIELQGDIDIEQYKFSSALKIREGLSVMPMKELKS